MDYRSLGIDLHCYKRNSCDPIITSLLDTDFYKLLMLQMIWLFYRDIDVTFTMMNRSKIRILATDIDEMELREQLDYARSLRFTKKELIWLAGNKFYGRKDIFDSKFLEWLEDFSLPEYDLRVVNGEYQISFLAKWPYATMWEIPALAIFNEMRTRAALRNMSMLNIDVLYSRAKTKLWRKIESLKTIEDIKLADYGTRRRHSFAWQDWCIQALKESLGQNFIGSSNILLAMNNDLEAVGTNAHELPMVVAAIAKDDQGIVNAPYEVMQRWQECYDGNLLIALPDVFGTPAFLHNAPDFLKDWKGFRPDSEPPLIAGERLIKWWESQGIDPREKLILFADGLDVEAIIEIYHNFKDRVQLGVSWGTNLTNDFKDCATEPNHNLEAISLVCKVTQANGRPAVKLTDTPDKSTGDPSEIERYRKIFAPYNKYS